MLTSLKGKKYESFDEFSTELIKMLKDCYDYWYEVNSKFLNLKIQTITIMRL